MNTKKKIAAILATTAAVAFAAAPLTVAFAHGKKVPCYGVNSCKGHGKCKTAQNACKGKNSCKGKGWMMMKEQACEKKGGSTTAPSDSSESGK